MRLFQCTLILVVLTCAFAAPKSSRTPRSSKSLRTSLEPSESLPAVEADTSDIKDATRAKKQATFCVEIKAAPENSKQCCMPQCKGGSYQPSQPSGTVSNPSAPSLKPAATTPEPPPTTPKPAQATYVLFTQGEPQQSISYIPMPVIHRQSQPMAHMFLGPEQPSAPEQSQLHQLPQPMPYPQPQLNPEPSQYVPYNDNSVDGPAPSILHPPSMPIHNQGPTFCPVHHASASNCGNMVFNPCPCTCGQASSDASTSHFRNFMGEQADMMAPINARMDPRMMMIPGVDQKRAGLVAPTDQMMRTAQMNAVENAFRQQQEYLHFRNPATQPLFAESVNGGTTTAIGQHGSSGSLNGAIRLGVGNMPQQNPLINQNPNVMVASPGGYQQLQLNPNSPNPFNEQKARTWVIRSVEQPKETSEVNTETPASSAQEGVTPVPSEGSENAQPSSPEMINQMRDSTPGQRVARADNSGGHESIFDDELSENKSQELSKREVEASATDSE